MERALRNQRLGHRFYWELKAELNSPSVGLMYGLILEAYMWATPECYNNLQQQLSVIHKCRTTLQNIDIDIGYQFDPHYTPRCFTNPLNPSQICKNIILPMCRIMNSARRPLMLFFENNDINYKMDLEPIGMVYKRGDDLRQDQLILQLLSVMDKIWKEDEDLDLRLTVYNCISTDTNEGM